jgi:prophage regulatory protein
MKAISNPDHRDDWLMRRPEVERATGLSRSALYAAIGRGEFPKPVPLMGRSVAWSAQSVAAWIAGRIAAAKAVV